MARSNSTSQAEASLSLALQLFPNADPAFVSSCISHHLHSPASSSFKGLDPAAVAARIVELVSHKLLEETHGGGAAGEWPTVKCWKDVVVGVDVELPMPSRDSERRPTPLTERRDLRDAFGSDPGMARARTNRSSERRRRVVDVTTERNLAFIRLHTVFPLVPIADLRNLILESDLAATAWRTSDSAPLAGPYVLWTGVEALLQRARHEQELQRRRRDRERNGGRGSTQLPTEWWNAFVGLLGFSTRDTATNKPVASLTDEADPILTPHDLFRSSGYETALIDHFESTFASSSTLRRREIERIVRREGGSYASLRQRLEARVLETQGRRGLEREESGTPSGGGGGLAKWWKRLIKVEAPPLSAPTSSSHIRTGRLDASENPYLRREIQAYEQSRLSDARPPSSLNRSMPVSRSPNVPETFECACCFADEPLVPASRFSCSADSTSGASHSFCGDCVTSLARTYTFGTSAFDVQALESYSLPCMAATANEPCSGRIPRPELDRALDQDLRTALDRRITDAVLERYGTSLNARSSAGKLMRCPFCPYAELADPLPGPLATTFFPVWVREPFPPSFGDVLRTLVGGLLVLPVFTIVLSILVFVTPARRLERAYDRLSTRDSDSSAAGDRVASPSVLSLPERLLLEPYLIPLVALSHLSSVCERVRSRKHGERTVFRCRNMGGSRLGTSASRASWQIVQRMEEVDRDLEWDVEQEQAEPFVEELRRERIVDYIWGSPAPGVDSQERETVSSSCGRMSCLLCHAALNPSAPSLHACASRRSVSSGPSSGASEQEQAEENLRLAVEKAMSAAVVRECGRCGVGLTKKGGEGACNKVTCRCGFAYCHACLRPISTFEGYAHFCPHPRDPRDPTRCPTGCDKCSLWLEPDLIERRKAAADRAREKWAEENPEWAEKVASVKSLRSVGADSHLVPAYETTLDYYDSLVEGCARFLLA